MVLVCIRVDEEQGTDVNIINSSSPLFPIQQNFSKCWDHQPQFDKATRATTIIWTSHTILRVSLASLTNSIPHWANIFPITRGTSVAKYSHLV